MRADEPLERAGLTGQLVQLGAELRREGVAVGTSELLDAFRALEQVDWRREREFREALGATLAKSAEERRLFELVCDRVFFRAVELAAFREGLADDVGERGGQVGPEEIEALRERIAAALRQAGASGAEGTLRDLARLAIAAAGGWQEGSGVPGVDIQRIRRTRAELQWRTGPARGSARAALALSAQALRATASPRTRAPAGPAPGHAAADAIAE